MDWIMLIGAGLCEMLGVAMMARLQTHRNWQTLALLMAGFGASFILLSLAMETLPMGTAYAVWTGIGASGGAILGMVLYGESRDMRRILCIVLILGAAVGLKLAG
ncbi:transporter [Paenibacillus sp. FSL R7-0273]|uniref:DMT family transporter n=1 Tax=Paenibacillus sp. FSL R7-0273 TaxID=1536772 RepID=UPI0004F594AE|nr:multidrug efflux SMR transporter [Paenibacillus sp. FSL R7-0273]AIQ45894.1 transporter [Paenibacillus sp. FSL R7-0273]OMF87454.1 QacE family quaternary ammonium compound efflux SMR transporter [Paenibacillus sp. FSL R7-0273]